MVQIMCEITEYLVNIMILLFTPTKVFAMDKDEMFEKYLEQSEKGAKMDASVKNNAEACWRWLTSKKALEKVDRPTALLDMLPREIAEEMDELLVTSIGKDVNHVMVPRSTVWETVYEEYLEKLKEFIEKKYTMELCEDEDRLQVNQTIWRKIEWVTMRHRGRREKPFPQLTKSLLPHLTNVLSRVQNAITEVSLYLLYKSMPMQGS
jgi:hypothetical protein